MGMLNSSSVLQLPDDRRLNLSLLATATQKAGGRSFQSTATGTTWKQLTSCFLLVYLLICSTLLQK